MRNVIVTYDVFKVMCEYSSQFASYKMPRDKWVECLGYLFAKVPGKADTEYIVQEAIGMTSGTEMRVEMPPDEFAQIERLLNERPGMFLGGWWHTHPGLSPFFSETDLDNQTFYQQGNEDGLGIVFDFSLIDDTFIGFKIYRLKSKNAREYDDIPYKLVGFTEEKLRKALDCFSGIPNSIVHNLAIHYGFGTGELTTLPDLEIPSSSDPIEDGHRNFSRAKVYVVQKKWDDAFKTLRIAAALFEKGKKYDLAIDTYMDIAKNSLTASNTAWAYDAFKRIDTILEIGEKEKSIDAINYYKGKRHASEALIRAKEGNLCLGAFNMQKAQQFYDPEEDFEEIYEAANMEGVCLERMGAIQLCLNAYKKAKLFGIRARDESEEDSKSKDWKTLLPLLDKKINELQNQNKSASLTRIT